MDDSYLSALPYDDRLKPCPFCGSDQSIHVDSGHDIDEGFYIECDNCWLYMGCFETEHDAIKTWNKRVDYMYGCLIASKPI
jgi:Lar family restriction alleviation protein